MTEAEIKTELAVVLYQRGKISMRKAAEVAGMNRIQFQFLLASRQIPISYDTEELMKDWETIQRKAS